MFNNTIPKAERTHINVKKEVDILVLLGALKYTNDSEWEDQYFAQPKPKTNQVSFLSGSINLNTQLKRIPHPMPKINIYF